MSRKRALWARAEAWAERNQVTPVCRYAAAEAFNAGYRAAMRDARKAVAADIDVDATLGTMVEDRLFPTIRAWLRPLR